MSLNTETIAMIDQAVHAASVARILEAERERLVHTIADVRAIDLDDAPDDHDRGEIVWQADDAATAASSTFARESGYGLIEEYRFLLDELDQADRRVESGRYGICESCGAVISAERLDAVPATRWCLSCAEAEERKRRPYESQHLTHA
jgi:RNA polymerase-binding transcription factor DksA